MSKEVKDGAEKVVNIIFNTDARFLLRITKGLKKRKTVKELSDPTKAAVVH